MGLPSPLPDVDLFRVSDENPTQLNQTSKYNKKTHKTLGFNNSIKTKGLIHPNINFKVQIILCPK